MKYDVENIDKRRKRAKITKKVIDIILIILLYNIILVFISCLNKIENVNLFGYKAYIITTNSMAPSINSGDVIIVKSLDEKEELQVGDVITFVQGSKVVTHRITNIEESGEKVYTTKGDNNNLEDNKKVEYDQIEGKVVVTIPKLGFFINILDNQIVFLLIVLLILVLLYLRVKKEEKIEKRREKRKIEQTKRREVS